MNWLLIKPYKDSNIIVSDSLETAAKKAFKKMAEERGIIDSEFIIQNMKSKKLYRMYGCVNKKKQKGGAYVDDEVLDKLEHIQFELQDLIVSNKKKKRHFPEYIAPNQEYEQRRVNTDYMELLFNKIDRLSDTVESFKHPPYDMQSKNDTQQTFISDQVILDKEFNSKPLDKPLDKPLQTSELEYTPPVERYHVKNNDIQCTIM